MHRSAVYHVCKSSCRGKGKVLEGTTDLWVFLPGHRDNSYETHQPWQRFTIVSTQSLRWKDWEIQRPCLSSHLTNFKLPLSWKLSEGVGLWARQMRSPALPIQQGGITKLPATTRACNILFLCTHTPDISLSPSPIILRLLDQIFSPGSHLY